MCDEALSIAGGHRVGMDRKGAEEDEAEWHEESHSGLRMHETMVCPVASRQSVWDQ